MVNKLTHCYFPNVEGISIESKIINFTDQPGAQLEPQEDYRFLYDALSLINKQNY